MTPKALVGKPVFGRHGRKVVFAVCVFEVIGLHPRSPTPTISELVRRHPILGGILLSLLAHHWYVEGRFLPSQPS